MQPYLLPYIGYLQLIKKCDVFVILDDVQYISRGWINRNRILVNGQPKYFTMPVHKADQTALINQRNYLLAKRETGRILRRIEAAYHRAPYYRSVMPLLEEMLTYGNSNVADFNHHSIEKLVAHLNIKTRIVRSSSMESIARSKGMDRVIAICKGLGSSIYVNPIGGIDLYRRDTFEDAGIALRFLQPAPQPYPQTVVGFVPYLSIVDVMMHNDPVAMEKRLDEFRILVSPQSFRGEHTELGVMSA